MYHYALGGNIAADKSYIDQLASPLGRSTLNILRFSAQPFNPSVTGWQLNFILSSADRRAALDMGLEGCPPPASISEHTQGMLWSTWLVTSPRKGGATRQQRKELLEWNLEEMKARNRRHGPQLCEKIDQYGSRIEKLAEAGVLDHSMGERWRQVQPHITAMIMPPLKLSLSDGIAYSKHKTFLVEADPDDNFVSHELTHLLGELDDWRSNEPATDILSLAINGKDPTTRPSFYVFGHFLLSQIFEQASIDTKMLSSLYSGKSPALNSRMLRNHIIHSTGEDKLGAYSRAIRAETARIKKHTPFGNDKYVYMFASAALLRQSDFERYTSTAKAFDIIAMAAPGRMSVQESLAMIDRRAGKNKP